MRPLAGRYVLLCKELIVEREAEMANVLCPLRLLRVRGCLNTGGRHLRDRLSLVELGVLLICAQPLHLILIVVLKVPSALLRKQHLEEHVLVFHIEAGSGYDLTHDRHSVVIFRLLIRRVNEPGTHQVLPQLELLFDEFRET